MLSIAALFSGSVVVIVLIYYLLLFVQQCWMLRDFRGPLALPMVGNIYQTEAVFLLRYLAKLRKRYGSMFTFFAFTKPYLVTCEPTAVRRILSDTKTFCKGEDYTTIFSLAFGQGLVTSNGDKHRVDRAMFGKYFIRSNISKYMSTINSITSNAIVTMLPQGSGEQKKPVNIEEFFATLALRVFMGFACTHTATPSKETEIAHLVSKGSFEMGRLVGLGLPLWDILPPVKYVKTATLALAAIFKQIVDDRRELLAKGDAKDIDDCLSAMIANNVSDKDMQDHMITLICAGHDTTAFFSAYMCYLLATNQDAQDKLRDEIRVTLNGKTELTADDMTEMKFLHNVMQETLRLYSIIPAVTRVATEEVHIKEASITIPKGATVMIPMFLINRDPELWDKPSEFNPDRFEGKGDFTSAKNGFFPFGYGARTCIGNTLAQLESGVFMCQLLMKFRLKADPGFKPAIMSGISLTTSNGINVILEKLE